MVIVGQDGTLPSHNFAQCCIPFMGREFVQERNQMTSFQRFSSLREDEGSRLGIPWAYSWRRGDYRSAWRTTGKYSLSWASHAWRSQDEPVPSHIRATER